MQEVLEVLQKLNLEKNITVVIVLHELNNACRFADNIIGLKKGEIICEGTPLDVINKDNLKKIYGPAVVSCIPQIVDEDKLTSANGIINQVGSVVNFLGPIFAGLLYGVLGIKVIVVINAISFLLSAIMEMFLDWLRGYLFWE